MQSTRFGEVIIDEEKIIKFPHGVPAFETHKEWVLLGAEDDEVKWLQSLYDGDTALPVCSPFAVAANYNVRFMEADIAELEFNNAEDLLLLAVLSIPSPKPQDMTVNLRAPIVVNQVNLKAVQAITDNEEYSLWHKVYPPAEENK